MPPVPRGAAALLAACLLCAALAEPRRPALAAAKEKRGWTMNSAGYLLGPHAIDRIFNDKHALAGKRDIWPEENIKAGAFGRWMDDSVVHTVIEFLTYLHLKETGALDTISTTVSSEETNQS